jgi:sugar fermentation stimulation protein A
LSASSDPRRKLPFTWELVEADGALVVVNTALGNRLVAEALAARAIPELADYVELCREVRLGAHSRVDFALVADDGTLSYVEVKSVTLWAGGQVSAFPDSVTARGRRHLEELERAARAGSRAVLLFCCVRDPTDSVLPADEIDPAYGKALRRAAAAGVELLAYTWRVTPEELTLHRRVPVLD